MAACIFVQDEVAGPETGRPLTPYFGTVRKLG